MAQTTQIVPKYSFPYVETVINDNTVWTDTPATTIPSTDVRLAFAVLASKGIDNVWVRKSTRKSAVKTFGESNFKKFGQPLMQALHVLDQDNSKVWMMRVMPENAAYANNVISVYFKADTAEEVAEAHKRKFRIKHTGKSFEGITTAKALADKAKEPDGVVANGAAYKDAEGYTQAQFMTARYTGRGTCGDLYSMRISDVISYEKEFGIKMYNFEIITSEAGLVKDADYVGSIVTSSKYEEATFINDLLEDSELGVAPVIVEINEEGVETVYAEYIKFINTLHTDLEAEYEELIANKQIPDDMLNGITPVTDQYKAELELIKEVEALIMATEAEELPDLDEFDLFTGRKVAVADEYLPAMVFPAKLTDDVDITADDYNAADYTSTENIVNFTSNRGVLLSGGSNGYFDEPRTVEDAEGNPVKRTVEEEVEECYNNAFNGTYDKRIISKHRINLTAIFDANYPFSVKCTLFELARIRKAHMVNLDAGIIDTLSMPVIRALITKYERFYNDPEKKEVPCASIDINYMTVKEPTTNKRCDVTTSYFLAAQYVNHLTQYGFHIPLVKEFAQVTGHVKDSLKPVIEEYDTDMKELLYNNRFNYYECVNENQFQRATQSTRQEANSDLLEENNVRILYVLKNAVEADLNAELYDFTDEGARQSFREIQQAKYASWVGSIIESFDIEFSTTEYELTRSILHAYIVVVFRGLNKRAICEIDINKRTLVNVTTEDEE